MAVALVAERLQGGTITAIDRSATALARARARNAESVRSGRVVLEQVALAAFRPDPGAFDVAFAINVNLFWTTDAAEECEVLLGALGPGAAVHLVYEGPARSARDVGPVVAANLELGGFACELRRHPDGAMFCVTGRRPADARSPRPARPPRP